MEDSLLNHLDLNRYFALVKGKENVRKRMNLGKDIKGTDS